MTTDTIDATLKMPKQSLLTHVCLSYDECSTNSCDACLDLPYRGNSTTGLDGGEDVDFDEEEPTCACGAPDGMPCICDVLDNDPNPELDPDYLAFLSSALPAAPTANTIFDTPDSFSPLETSTVAGREDAALLQTPNLRDRLNTALAKARAAQSRIDRREWTEEAFSLIERLADTGATCACGVAYNNLTGRCEACDERERLMSALRSTAGTMAFDIDTECGF